MNTVNLYTQGYLDSLDRKKFRLGMQGKVEKVYTDLMDSSDRSDDVLICLKNSPRKITNVLRS